MCQSVSFEWHFSNFVFLVVPQPVYMNMNDLKALAAQKAAAATGTQPEFPELPEDSPELKTPTAEDIMVPEQKVRYNFV